LYTKIEIFCQIGLCKQLKVVVADLDSITYGM
jgi:hypothetical protein